MTQNERLDYLVEAFKADSGEYRNLRTPKDTEGKRRILRSLMNIRMPGEMDESVVEIRHCQRREFSDAGMFCPDAYLY